MACLQQNPNYDKYQVEVGVSSRRLGRTGRWSHSNGPDHHVGHGSLESRATRAGVGTGVGVMRSLVIIF